MKKWYKKYKVSEHERIDTTTLMINIFVSCMFIVMCLSITSFSAYAFFSASINSNSNKISSAAYVLEVNYIENDIIKENGLYTLVNDSLDSDRVFHINLWEREDDTSTATVGYGRIEVYEDVIGSDSEITSVKKDIFYTKPIGMFIDETEGYKTLYNRYYKITVPANTTYKIRVIGEWGSCSQPAIGESGYIVEITLDAYMHEQELYNELLEQEIIDIEIEPSNPNGEEDIVIDPSNPGDDVEDKPADDPKDEPGDSPADDPKDEPGDTPGEQPKDEPGDTPGEEPKDNPVDEPKDDPTDKPEDDPKDSGDDVVVDPSNPGNEEEETTEEVVNTEE